MKTLLDDFIGKKVTAQLGGSYGSGHIKGKFSKIMEDVYMIEANRDTRFIFGECLLNAEEYKESGKIHLVIGSEEVLVQLKNSFGDFYERLPLEKLKNPSIIIRPRL